MPSAVRVPPADVIRERIRRRRGELAELRALLRVAEVREIVRRDRRHADSRVVSREEKQP
jgi:hypothetical protein